MGVLLLLIGIMFEYFSVQSVYSNLPNYSSSATQSVAVQPKSDFFIPISISNVSILEMVYNSTEPIDFYLINSTAHNLLQKANSTLIENATYLHGNGLVYQIDNSSYGIFPYQENLTQAQRPVYWAGNGTGNQTLFANGTYYAVFQNYGNKSNTVFYATLNRSLSSIASSEESYSFGNIGLNIGGSISVIAGIILLIYGLLSRSKTDEKNESAEAEMLYRAIEKKHYPKTKTKRTGKKSRKRR